MNIKEHLPSNGRIAYTVHAALGEGSTASAKARKKIARQSVARLVQFYKNGRMMHSGNCTLTGASKANAADKKIWKDCAAITVLLQLHRINL